MGKIFEDSIFLTKVYDSSAYAIETNQEKVIKFYDKDDKVIYSPQVLTIVAKKDKEILARDRVEIKVEYFDGKDWVFWPSFPLGYFEYNDRFSQWELHIQKFIDNVSNPEFIETITETYDNTEILEEDSPENYLDKESIQNLLNTLITGETFFKIYLIEQQKVKAIDPIEVSWGTSNEMAKFEVNATSINALVQDSKMVFDANGLTLVNGAFKIIENDGDMLLGSDQGNLYVKGHIEANSGSFTGTINATDGSFTGTINATDGYLNDLELKGQLTIGDNFIIQNRPTILNNGIEEPIQEDYPVIFHPNFSVDNTGHVTANYITLGIGATIEDYIRFGEKNESEDNNAFLYNPDKHDGVILEAGKNENTGTSALKMTNSGSIFLGNGMTINGKNDTISSGLYIKSEGGSGWHLDNKNAIFNNASIRGSLKATAFEYGEVQAIGGIVVIRPSSIVKEVRFVETVETKENVENISEIVEGTLVESSNKIVIFTLENSVGFLPGDYGEFTDSNAKNTVNDEGTANEINVYRFKVLFNDYEKNQITVQNVEGLEDITNIDSWEDKVIISYGQTKNSTAIAINSSTDDSFCSPQSISVFEINTDQNSNSFFNRTNKVILGKLPSELNGFANLYDEGTYGLFAENVLLRGSLISAAQNSEDKNAPLAGISSNSGFNMPTGLLTGNATSGEVFIWAGKNKNVEGSSPKYPFMVDNNGNFYASSGYFEGSVLSKATIQAAEIKTARITGIGTDPEFAESVGLTITNVSTAIDFKKIDGTEEVSVMKLSTDGLKLGTNLNFDSNSSYNITNVGAISSKSIQLVAENSENSEPGNSIKINGQLIELTTAITNGNENETFSGQIQLDSTTFGNKTVLGLTLSNGKNTAIKLDQEESIYMKGNDVWLYDNILFGDGTVRNFEYRAHRNGDTIDGYDLYVR